MPAQALLADYRLSFKYTVDTFVHVCRQYLDAVASGDASGYDTVGNFGLGNHPVSTVDIPFFTPLKPFYNPAHDSFDSVTLEKRSGSTWVYQYSFASSIAPTGGSTVGFAMGKCLAGKDTHNRNMPVYFYEGAFGATQKIASYASENAAGKALIDAFWNVGGGATSGMPYAWRMSRDDTGAPLRYLGDIIDSNQKLRRARRIS